MKEFIYDMWTESLIGKMMLVFMGLFIFVLLPATIYASVLEEREWQDFRAAHDCQIVAYEKGTTSTGVGYGVTGNGNMGTIITTNTTADKTSWLCSDGITYTR